MHRSYRKIFGSALAGVSALALTLPTAPIASAAASKSASGVARISNVTGGVDVRRSGVDGNYAAALNAPVSVGDYIATQRNGRSEVEFDHAMTLRLAPGTQVRFTHLTPDDHEVQLAQGTVELRLFHSINGHPVVETPSAVVRPVEAGRYRVTVDAKGKTTVSVRSGRVAVTAPNGSDPYLGPGQAIEADGYGSSARFYGGPADAYDSFDGWCDGRDAGWSHVSNWSYDDAGMVGVNDMSDYGQWSNDPQYGQVWTPGEVPSNWSPYSDGQYVWDPNYGWTWVGDEPWGYAPYHYGRWFHGDRGWGWAPGGYDDGDSYGYQPAVVGFFALGAGIGVGFSIGDVGWVPLAPGEAYNPWWNGGGGWNGGGNYDNLGNAGNYYRNAQYGAVGVSGSNFANGNFAHARRYDRSQLSQARAFRGAVPVVPTSRNLAFNARNAAPVRNFASSRNFTRMAAPRVAHVAFANQRTAVASVARKQHPTFAPSIARQVKAPNRGAGFTNVTVARKAGAARPAVATRAKPATGRRTAGVAAPHARAARPAQVTRKAGAARPAVATRAKPASVWNRFGGGAKPKAAAPHAATGTARNATASKRAAYAAPHANAARAAAATSRTRAAAPVVHHAYVAPVVHHAYVAPVVHHAYVAPVVHHAYVAPVVHHAYVAPVVHHAYVAPVVHAAPRAAAPAPRAAVQRAAPPAAHAAPPHEPAHH